MVCSMPYKYKTILLFWLTKPPGSIPSDTIPAKSLSNLFEILTWPQKMTLWLTSDVFVRSPATAPPADLQHGFTVITDHPNKGKVWPGCGLQSGVSPVIIPIGFRSQAVESAGGWQVRTRAASLALSKWTVDEAPHRSGQFSKTGRLYSTVTHHTHNSLHVPGSSYLDPAGLSLLVRNWGPTLPHQLPDAPHSSHYI
jgi:hypothetical protein